MPAIKARRYLFTSYAMDIEPTYDDMVMNYLCYGKEVCPTTGRRHFQGYVEFKDQKTLRQAQAAISHPSAHFEVARGNAEENKTYCKKEGDFKEFGTSSVPGQRNDLNQIVRRIQAGEAVSDMYFDETAGPIIARHMVFFRSVQEKVHSLTAELARKEKMEGAVLRPWQQRYVSIVELPPHDRHVYWIYDTRGNTGKSFLADYLIAMHGAVVYTGGKVADIAHAYNRQPVVIFDLARTTEDKLDAVYTSIENFKNGRFFSPKYESVFKTFPVPHVVVFANFAPDRSKLSEDRWRVREIIAHDFVIAVDE